MDQIIIVDDQRTKPEHFAPFAKTRRIRLRNSGGAPHPTPRAGGKYLQRVCAEFVGYFERGGKMSGDRCMDSDAGAAVFPSGNFRWRRRFRTILISCVKYELATVVVFRHYLWVSGSQEGRELRAAIQQLRAHPFKQRF